MATKKKKAGTADIQQDAAEAIIKAGADDGGISQSREPDEPAAVPSTAQAAQVQPPREPFPRNRLGRFGRIR